MALTIYSGISVSVTKVNTRQKCEVVVDVPEGHPLPATPGWRWNSTGIASSPSLLRSPPLKPPSHFKSQSPNQLNVNSSSCEPPAQRRYWGRGYECGLWASWPLPSSNGGRWVQEEPTSQSFRCHFDPATCAFSNLLIGLRPLTCEGYCAGSHSPKVPARTHLFHKVFPILHPYFNLVTTEKQRYSQNIWSFLSNTLSR